MRHLVPFLVLMLAPVAWAEASTACEEHREEAAYIMDARLAGERREALAADLAGGGPPSSRLIRLITDVYALPVEDLRGDARTDRLDEFYAECVED